MIELKLLKFNIYGNELKVSLSRHKNDDRKKPKLKIIFRSGNLVRRLPLLYSHCNGNEEIYGYTYLLDQIFTDMSSVSQINVSFDFDTGTDYYENVNVITDNGTDTSSGFGKFRLYDISKYKYTAEIENKSIFINVKRSKKIPYRIISFIFRVLMLAFAVLSSIVLLPFICIYEGLKTFINRKISVRAILSSVKEKLADYVRTIYRDKEVTTGLRALTELPLKKYYNRCCKEPIVQNRISFISGRRNELSGNEKFVYDLIKDRDDIEFCFLTKKELSRNSSKEDRRKFYKLYATSKVVVVDDYFNLLDSVKKRDGVTLFQLWHACGAFKTFGFSRLGKEGGPVQTAPSHRMYDYATVSSENIIKYYAEGFGVNDSNIIASGIPRTDIFLDSQYAENARNDFYSKYPEYRNKKIIMFAPTFRGAGQNGAFYDMDAFDPDNFINNISDEYSLIIKLHPFCKERYSISEENKNRIIDLTDEEELNDLLFVTDLLITDYSSSIFEASLLNIPMLFYAYDLEKYISERDFYGDFESFVPGKIVKTQAELEKSVKENNFEKEKIETFRALYFDNIDGKSSQRTADAIINSLNYRKADKI